METIAKVAVSKSSTTAALLRKPQMTFAQTVRAHWREYAIEAALIGLFMISACTFGVIYEHPFSPVRRLIESAFVRRVAMGLSMGLTAVALIYSPLGKRSGAHFNPAVSLTFLRLGKISRPDALMYALLQCVGAMAGTVVASLYLRDTLAHPSVRFVVTVPGQTGRTIAFVSEFAISFLLMSTVLYFAAHPLLVRFTGMAAGILVSTFITFEAPFSGMSMNFARTIGSAVSAHVYTGLWIYFVAPLIGMLAAAEIHMRWNERAEHHCAKLHHNNHHRCIFCGANGGFRHE